MPKFEAHNFHRPSPPIFFVEQADLASGDIIELGGNTTVEGNVEAKSSLRLSLGVEIYESVDAGGAHATVGDLTSEVS